MIPGVGPSGRGERPPTTAFGGFIMFGIGAAEIGIVLLSALGTFGVLPTGVPAPSDPAMQAAAPEECLLYVAKNGEAKPDSKSTNQIEQLLAEPEVREFVEEIGRLIEQGSGKIPANTQEQQTILRTVPVIADVLLTREVMLYLAKVDLPPQAPGGNAALVVAAGDKLKPLVVALEELEQLLVSKLPPNMTVEKFEAEGAQMRRMPTPPGVPQIVWGVQGSYVFLAVGEGEAAALAKKLAKPGTPPAWLTQTIEEAEVPRIGAMLYLNLEGAIKTAEPLLGLIPRGGPVDPEKIIEALGVRHLKHLAVVSGLNEETAVSKLIVRHDGKGAGLLSLLQGEPIKAEDFGKIPADSELALVTRFDAQAVYDRLKSLAGEIEPRAVEEFDRARKAAEDQLGFSFQDDVLAGLGNRIVVYNSASEGGLLATGLCAALSVRDASRVEKVIEKLRRLAESEQNQERPEFAVRKSEVGGKLIHYVQFLREPIPFAPAWCVTDTELVVGITPQIVKAHLGRSEDGTAFLTKTGLDKHVAKGDVTGISYIDPKMIYQLLYSYANLGVCAGASVLEKELGIRADLTKFPTYGVISRHMRPTIGVSRATKETWIGETYATGPTVGVGTIGLMGVSLLAPAVQQAQATAQANTSRNNMRNIGLAAFQRTLTVNKPLPRAITDPDGKPLLSWRVAILPYLDQQALYDQFKLDEPWDSEHNLPLSRSIPAMYTHPGYAYLTAEGKTMYQIPYGKGALYEDIDGPDDGVFNRAPGGRTGTVVLVEASSANAVVWTKPDDLSIDESTVRYQLNYDRGGVNLLFADQHIEAVQIYGESDERIRTMFFPRAKRE
jgi:hypothetical protein